MYNTENMEKVGYFYHATSEQNRVSICTTNTLTPQVHNPPQGWMLLVDRSIKHLVPDGVFFCATLYNGDLPTISPYGSERVRVPISEVIRQLGGQVELYQGKGMDNRENRYVRLMMVRQGYTNPILQHMSKLDLADNEWLRSTPNGFLVARRPTWVVIYIPESINVTECLWDNGEICILIIFAV